MNLVLAAQTIASPSDAVFAAGGMPGGAAELPGLIQQLAVTNKLLGIIIAFLLLFLIWRVFSLVHWFVRDFMFNQFHF